MTGARVLVVDDEQAIRRLLQTTLSHCGYLVELAADGQSAISQARNWRPDVILLDLGLPDMSGREVCTAIRAWSNVPIIILSVQNAEQEKIASLDAGADDYITKPFSVNELLARIRVALRHTAAIAAGAPVLIFDELQIDLDRRLVLLANQELHLTPTEYELLKLFATNAGRVLTHAHILRDVWGVAYEHDTQTLRYYITQLRRKLGDDPLHTHFIHTEPGIGYRFRATTDPG